MKNWLRINLLNIIIGILALFTVVIHLIFSYNLEFHRDELLYFSLGRHPAFGYATVPPMIGWIAWTMQNIFGYSLFAVRIFPALLGGLMVFLISALAKELGGSGYSRILAALGIILSIFGLRTFLLFQPVHIDLILWTLSFYLVIKYINTLSGKYLILFGLTAGLAMLNKYLIGVLFFSFIIIIPFTQYRTLLRNRKFWYGILAGILVFSPNLIWQIVNGLPVFHHLSELKRTQLVNVDQSAFLIEQLVAPGAASILTVAGLIFLLINKKVRKFRFLGFVVLSVIITLMLLHGKSYYAQGIFPFLIATGAVSWGNLLKKTWLKIFLPLLLIILT
jgi:4-amino-4-deoxy-L-arabinose transferase-like glycosyltransferase